MPAGGDDQETVCPRCGESKDLAKVKGCIRCLRCGYKFDYNGW
jgi:ribosomal protein S27AE